MLASQISIKLFAAPGTESEVQQEQLIAVFHRWIRELQHRMCGKLLIDVADYRHVKDGPGVVLIGHEAHWGVGGLAGGGLGLHYSRKRDPEGDLAGKLVEAFHDALAAATMLESEAGLGLRFDAGRARVRLMSRLHAANDASGFAAARPELEAFGARLWASPVKLSHRADDPRAALTVDLEGRAASIADLMPRLG